MSGTTAKPFNIDDLDPNLSNQDRLIMAETILAWADLDTGISRLILLVFGVQDDAGSILIGNMDLKTKVEKIKALNDHHTIVKNVTTFTKIAKEMKKCSDCRNVIAHRKCVGKLTSSPQRLVFLSAKHVKKVPGQFEMIAIGHSEFVNSAKFARQTSDDIHTMICSIEDRLHHSKSS